MKEQLFKLFKYLFNFFFCALKVFRNSPAKLWQLKKRIVGFFSCGWRALKESSFIRRVNSLYKAFKVHSDAYFEKSEYSLSTCVILGTIFLFLFICFCIMMQHPVDSFFTIWGYVSAYYDKRWEIFWAAYGLPEAYRRFKLLAFDPTLGSALFGNKAAAVRLFLLVIFYLCAPVSLPLMVIFIPYMIFQLVIYHVFGEVKYLLMIKFINSTVWKIYSATYIKGLNGQFSMHNNDRSPFNVARVKLLIFLIGLLKTIFFYFWLIFGIWLICVFWKAFLILPYPVFWAVFWDFIAGLTYHILLAIIVRQVIFIFLVFNWLKYDYRMSLITRRRIWAVHVVWTTVRICRYIILFYFLLFIAFSGHWLFVFK